MAKYEQQADMDKASGADEERREAMTSPNDRAEKGVRRYRFSPTRGLVEDDGGIYPLGVSQPMVLAEVYDECDRARMLAQGWGESILEKLTEVYEERNRLRARIERYEQDYPVKCARCGIALMASDACAEEGDEWECSPCWERCEAQERLRPPGGEG